MWKNAFDKDDGLLPLSLAVKGSRVHYQSPSGQILCFNSDTAYGFQGQKGVYLQIVNAADGRQISEAELPAMPVFDGLSAANGRLYRSTLDGQVRCLSGTAK